MTEEDGKNGENSESTANAGEITGNENFGVLARLVAYQTIKEIGKKVGEVIGLKIPVNSKLLIISDLDQAFNLLAGGLPLIQYEAQSQWFKTLLEEQNSKNVSVLDSYQKLSILPDKKIQDLQEALKSFDANRKSLAASLTLPVITGVVQDLANIFGLFQVNFDIKGQDLTISPEALFATVASQIIEFDSEVYLPNFSLIKDSDVMQNLVNLLERFHHMKISYEMLNLSMIKPIDTQLNNIKNNIEELKGKLADLDKKIDSSKVDEIEKEITKQTNLQINIEQLLAEAKVEQAATEALEKEFNNFINLIIKPGENNLPSPIVQAAIQKFLSKQGITHLLRLNVLTSAGLAITKKWLWSSGDTSFIGGGAISYSLATVEGQIIATDMLIAADQLDHTFKKPNLLDPGTSLHPVLFENQKTKNNEPMDIGYAEGKKVYFTSYVSSLASAPTNPLGNVYIFSNGVIGASQSGLQLPVFDKPPKTCATLFQMNLVTWKSGPRGLKFAKDILAAEKAGELTINKTDTTIRIHFMA